MPLKFLLFMSMFFQWDLILDIDTSVHLNNKERCWVDFDFFLNTIDGVKRKQNKYIKYKQDLEWGNERNIGVFL